MIVVIDYGMGNIRSILKAFERLGIEAKYSSRIEDIMQAKKLVLLNYPEKSELEKVFGSVL